MTKIVVLDFDALYNQQKKDFFHKDQVKKILKLHKKNVEIKIVSSELSNEETLKAFDKSLGRTYSRTLNRLLSTPHNPLTPGDIYTVQKLNENNNNNQVEQDVINPKDFNPLLSLIKNDYDEKHATKLDETQIIFVGRQECSQFIQKKGYKTVATEESGFLTLLLNLVPQAREKEFKAIVSSSEKTRQYLEMSSNIADSSEGSSNKEVESERNGAWALHIPILIERNNLQKATEALSKVLPDENIHFKILNYKYSDVMWEIDPRVKSNLGNDSCIIYLEMESGEFQKSPEQYKQLYLKCWHALQKNGVVFNFNSAPLGSVKFETGNFLISPAHFTPVGKTRGLRYGLCYDFPVDDPNPLKGVKITWQDLMVHQISFTKLWGSLKDKVEHLAQIIKTETSLLQTSLKNILDTKFDLTRAMNDITRLLDVMQPGNFKPEGLAEIKGLLEKIPLCSPYDFKNKNNPWGTAPFEEVLTIKTLWNRMTSPNAKGAIVITEENLENFKTIFNQYWRKLTAELETMADEIKENKKMMEDLNSLNKNNDSDSIGILVNADPRKVQEVYKGYILLQNMQNDLKITDDKWNTVLKSQSIKSADDIAGDCITDLQNFIAKQEWHRGMLGGRTIELLPSSYQALNGAPTKGKEIKTTDSVGKIDDLIKTLDETSPLGSRIDVMLEIARILEASLAFRGHYFLNQRHPDTDKAYMQMLETIHLYLTNKILTKIPLDQDNAELQADDEEEELLRNSNGQGSSMQMN